MHVTFVVYSQNIQGMFLYLIFPEYYLGIFPGISKGTFSEYSRNIYWECSTNTPRTCICPVGFCLTFALIVNFYYNEYPLNMRLFFAIYEKFYSISFSIQLDSKWLCFFIFLSFIRINFCFGDPPFPFQDRSEIIQFGSNRLAWNIDNLLNIARWRFKFLEIFCIHHKQNTVNKFEIRHYTSTNKQTNLTTNIT